MLLLQSLLPLMVLGLLLVMLLQLFILAVHL
jgi:hypothetical protein